MSFLFARIQHEENFGKCAEITKHVIQLIQFNRWKSIVSGFLSAALKYVLCSWKPAVTPRLGTQGTQTRFFSTVHAQGVPKAKITVALDLQVVLWIYRERSRKHLSFHFFSSNWALPEIGKFSNPGMKNVEGTASLLGKYLHCWQTIRICKLSPALLTQPHSWQHSWQWVASVYPGSAPEASTENEIKIWAVTLRNKKWESTIATSCSGWEPFIRLMRWGESDTWQQLLRVK